ncbi:hypothetical protein F2Q70_00036252 [Brassica cretica]|uniref:Uncharacterized protein n=1 Tax=Brassica cretica TaxID=69181 RepID=A0A8S9JX48_BRACR|nr:hypothetical protein F2Q70_00036252 [Brassica cretica]
MVKAQVEVKGKARRGRPPKNINVSEDSCSLNSGRPAPNLHRPWFQEQHLSLTPSTLIGQLSDEALLAVANGRQAGQRRQQIRRTTLSASGSRQAIVWVGEAVVKETRNSPRMFSICCQQGRVKLPPRRQPPSPLKELLDRPSFVLQIRVANGMLSFTSMGGQIDHTVTGTPGPFAFRLHGQTHHRIGSLLPPEGTVSAVVYSGHRQ